MGAGTMAIASVGVDASVGANWPLQDSSVGGAGSGRGFGAQQAWHYEQPAMVAPPRPPSPPKIPNFR